MEKSALACGYLVEVSVARLRAEEQKMLFAVSISDEKEAAAALCKALGGLHCSARIRCRFSARALQQLNVHCGGIKQLDADQPSYDVKFKQKGDRSKARG